MSSKPPTNAEEPSEDNEALLDASEAAEEIADDGDHPMDSDPEDTAEPEEEIQLQNDSIAHFDLHTDSIFCIVQHPLDPSLIATGSGDDKVFVFSANPPSRVLPTSYETNPSPERPSLEPNAELGGHTDSVNALTFSLPNGNYLISGGLDGHVQVFTTTSNTYTLLASATEVEEINFLIPNPHPSHPDSFALGASDGSAWVYTIDPEDKATGPLRQVQAYYLHRGSCTAGAWTPDGKLLATVSEDGSLNVYDVFGEAAAQGISGHQGTVAIVSLSSDDQRFSMDGGIFSVAIAPSGAFVVVGGGAGMIRVVSLPRLSPAPGSVSAGQKGAKSKAGGGKKAGVSSSAHGVLLNSFQLFSDSVESLSFSSAPYNLLAACSTDGSIALFDTTHNFAVRRHIKEAHEGHAVVQVEFVREEGREHLLTSCGLDGVVSRWDTRGGTAAAGQGLLSEWRGHRGGGEGGGVLGFVQGGKEGRIVTVGDDAVSLVFDAEKGIRRDD